jgi:hypothetical protein
MTTNELLDNLARRMAAIEALTDGVCDNGAEKYNLLFDAIQDEAIAAGFNIGAALHAIVTEGN